MPRILRLRFKHGQNRKYEEDVEQNVFRGVTFKAQHHVPTKIIYDFMAFAPVYSSRDNHSIIRASIAALETLLENVRQQLPSRNPNAPRNEPPDSNSLGMSCVRLLADADELLETWKGIVEPRQARAASES